jgi:hypothetical protein
MAMCTISRQPGERTRGDGDVTSNRGDRARSHCERGVRLKPAASASEAGDDSRARQRDAARNDSQRARRNREAGGRGSALSAADDGSKARQREEVRKPSDSSDAARMRKYRDRQRRGIVSYRLTPSWIDWREAAVRARLRKSPEQVTVGDLAAEFEPSPPAEPAGAQNRAGSAGVGLEGELPTPASPGAAGESISGHRAKR